MSDLHDAFKTLAKRVGTTQIQRWRLGRGDGSGTVQNPTDPNPRTVWIWRDSVEGREIGTAVLDSNANIPYANLAAYENIEVQVGYPPASSLRHVMGLTDLAGLTAVGGITPLEQVIQGSAAPQAGSISTMRVDPTSYTTPTLSVNTSGFFYIKPSTRSAQYQVAGSLSLSAIIGAIAAGKHRYSWAYYDYEAGAWSVVSSADQTPSNTLPSRGDFSGSNFASLTVPYTAKKVVPIYLYNGQTGVAEADFYRSYDARLEFPIVSEDPAANRLYLYQWFI